LFQANYLKLEEIKNMKKLILYLILVLIILLSAGCFDGPWTDVRNVPFRAQLTENYCGIACIQMWSLFDDINPEPTQDEIYSFLMENSNHGGYIWADDLVVGVGQFTRSIGYLKDEIMNNLGQDRCISASIASIKDFRLSIMPFSAGRHAVLVVGYKWHYENDQRVADKMFYHDPNSRGDLFLTAADLKQNYFLIDNNRGSYWVIVGRHKNVDDGFTGYMNFIAEGGTYYGGPAIYDPTDPEGL
jgi:Peptidase_C39 like family